VYFVRDKKVVGVFVQIFVRRFICFNSCLRNIGLGCSHFRI
jgi:hypothetical protein